MTPTTTTFTDTTLNRLDDWLELWGDRLNPVLVRETRQILNSRRFVWLFLAALGLSWLMMLIGVIGAGASLDYHEAGGGFFVRFFRVLIFCLFFAVPSAVFRNMMSEFRERTFETLVITTLTPQRIVFGKLQGGLLQMAIYFSAIAPFICFTYLLGGIGLVDIAGMLLLAFAVSSGLCFAALLLGSLAKQPTWEVINMLLLMVAACIAFSVCWGVSEGVAYGLGNSIGLLDLFVGTLCGGLVLFFCFAISWAIAIEQFTPTYPRHAHIPGSEHTESLRSIDAGGALHRDAT